MNPAKRVAQDKPSGAETLIIDLFLVQILGSEVLLLINDCTRLSSHLITYEKYIGFDLI